MYITSDTININNCILSLQKRGWLWKSSAKQRRGNVDIMWLDWSVFEGTRAFKKWVATESGICDLCSCCTCHHTSQTAVLNITYQLMVQVPQITTCDGMRWYIYTVFIWMILDSIVINCHSICRQLIGWYFGLKLCIMFFFFKRRRKHDKSS